MNINNVIDKLLIEINGRNKKDVVQELQDNLVNCVSELSQNENFYKLPLINIFAIISQIDLSSLNKSDALALIYNIIQNTIKTHNSEKETLLLLHYIDVSSLSLSYDEILSLLGLFSNCSILKQLYHLYETQKNEIDRDFEYELEQKDEQINKLKNQLNERENYDIKPIAKKPINYETFFKACQEGKLESVKWFVEIEKTDVNIRDGWNAAPLHYACSEGHLNIVQYLVIKGADVNAVDQHKNHCIHFAAKAGHLQIVQYLIEKQNVDKDVNGCENWTPLHMACWNDQIDIIEYLLSNGADLEAKDINGQTPLHIAAYWNQYNAVSYLVGIGANKNAKNNKGKLPYDLTNRDMIKDILGD